MCVLIENPVLTSPFFFCKIRADGGLSKSHNLRQVLADLSGREVWSCADGEATARGAAAAAGVGAGIWTWEEVDKLLDDNWIINRPMLDAKIREREREQWKRDLAKSYEHGGE